MNKQVSNVAFIGLGVMGFPMAGHLASTGYVVNIFNRTPAKAAKWLTNYSGEAFESPAEAAKGARFVMLCVGNDDDIRQVVYGDTGVLNSMQPGSVLIDHTTASAQLARELHQACADKQIGFLDAPVSGGQAGAENGKLTIMVGGDKTTFEKAEAVLSCYSRCAKRLGEAGAGQLAKMMNQICIAGIIQGLAEALHFGQQAGLDCHAVIEVISQGAAQSWQMDNRATTMLNGQYDFGFAVDWMRKDLAIALDEARRNGSTLPLTALVDQYYADVQTAGNGRFDTSSLLTRLEKAKGV